MMGMLCESFIGSLPFGNPHADLVRASFLSAPKDNHRVVDHATAHAIAAAESERFQVYTMVAAEVFTDDVGDLIARMDKTSIVAPHRKIFVELGRSAFSFIEEKAEIEWFRWMYLPKSGIKPLWQGRIDKQSGLFIEGRTSPDIELIACVEGMEVKKIEDSVPHGALLAIAILRILTLPRLVHVERCRTREAIWKQRGRFAGTALPLISVNKVTLPLPGSPQFRGEVIETGHGGIRQHNVRGHYRLIGLGSATEDKPPQWIFVPEHTRGDPSKGCIVKHRMVAVDRGRIHPSGYLFPGFPLAPGQRVPARKAS